MSAPPASTPTHGPRLAATCAVLMVVIGLGTFDRWAVAREPLAQERLRQARVALQRAESLRATLAAAPVRLSAIDATLEALSLAILEAAERAGALPGVSRLHYLLSTDEAREQDIHTLRLTLQASVQHESVLLTLLDALRTPVALRPHRVAGCRVLRVPPSARPAAALTLDCAIDWTWWPSV